MLNMEEYGLGVCELLQSSESGTLTAEFIMRELALDEAEYRDLKEYLEADHVVRWAMPPGFAGLSGMQKGPRFLNWWDTTREKYLPLTFNAKRLARSLLAKSPALGRVKRPWEVVGWPYETTYLDAARELIYEGLAVEDRVGDQEKELTHLQPLVACARAVRDDFRRESVAAPAQSITFEGDRNIVVMAGNMSGIVESYQNQVSETVDVVLLKEQVEESLSRILDALRGELDQQSLERYESQVLNPLRTELAKPPARRDIGKIRRLLAVVSALADMEGVIQFGERAMQIAGQLAPYVVTLLTLANRLVELGQ
jgi:hypothetical protein